jgi:ribosomal protein S18 acetylase RimI-like enzyme
LAALRFRRFEPEDIAKCLDLYTRNEPGRFPAGVKEDYATLLSEQSTYVLVAEKDGRLVASGGLFYYSRKNMAGLCFGLVHPQFQGTGIGTTMVLARLALLSPAAWNLGAYLCRGKVNRVLPATWVSALSVLEG